MKNIIAVIFKKYDNRKTRSINKIIGKKSIN